jgi:uncharacterized membrane protein YeaQ/YmgE (transglycosylase-associated protein family)
VDLVVWLAIGATVGWLGSLLLDSDPEHGVFVNVVIGSFGALVGGWLVGPLVGVGPAARAALSPAGALVALLGAVLLLVLFAFARRVRLR